MAAAVVVVVVALAAVVEVVDAAVVGVLVDAPEAVVVLTPVSDAATVVAVVEACWRAMPRPRALAMPTLREATRARLRAAGWGRFVVMG